MKSFVKSFSSTRSYKAIKAIVAASKGSGSSSGGSSPSSDGGSSPSSAGGSSPSSAGGSSPSSADGSTPPAVSLSFLNILYWIFRLNKEGLGFCLYIVVIDPRGTTFFDIPL